MTNPFVEKVKRFLLSPSKAFQDSKADSLGAAFRYYVLLLIIFTILTALVASAVGIVTFTSTLDQIAASSAFGAGLAELLRSFQGFVVALDIFFVYCIFIIMLFAVFFEGFFYHVFVLLFGGEKGVTITIKTVMYALTPALLLGWIPYIAFIGAIWSVILLILGLKETQDMTLGRAFLVVIVPIILVLLLVIFAAIVIGVFLTTLMTLAPPINAG